MRGRRSVLALLAAAALLGLATGGSFAGALDPGHAAAPADGPAAGAAANRPAYVVVAEGDTLWDLAGPHAPAGTDPAVYVARVAAEAGLDPRALVPGTVVNLP